MEDEIHENDIVEVEPFPHKIGAFALIFRKTGKSLEVLLVKRRDLSIWNLPGGGADSGETTDQAAIRETREETGLDIKRLCTVGIVYDAPRSRNGVSIGAEVREDIFGGVICTVTGGSIIKGAESEEIAFFPVDSLPPDMYERHRLLTEFAVADPENEYFIEQAMRQHHGPSIENA